MEFNPPLSEFSDLGLIEIIESGTEEYQQKYIDKAKEELKRRSLTEEEYVRLINEYYGSTYIHEYQQVQIEKQQKEANKTKSYTAAEMALIVLLSPLILINRYYRDKDSLTGLWTDNFKRKFWQRLFCLLLGIGLWYFVLRQRF